MAARRRVTRAAWLLLFIAFPAVAAPPTLHSPYDVAARRRIVGMRVPATPCPAEAGAPQRDIKLAPFYVDSAYSIVDPAKHQRYLDEAKALAEFSFNVAHAADAWVRSQPPQPSAAACALSWMDRWAQADAMLGEMTEQGQHQRKWVLAGAALAYLKIRDAPALDAAAKARVTHWFGRVAAASLAYYATYPRAQYSNHFWWLGLALAATATATNDRAMFDKALELYRDALDDIQPDGSLPYEMLRKGRALPYHVVSLEALVLLAEFGEANGIDLYAEKDGALHRLANRVRDGLADPSWFVQRTGTAVDWSEGANWAWTVSWAEPYYARFPDPALGRLIEPNRPVFLAWMGGDVTDDFGSAAIPFPVRR